MSQTLKVPVNFEDKYIEQLELRNRELAEEAVRLTNAYNELSAQVAEDHNHKLRGWAIDRAIEALKYNKDGGNAGTVIESAEVFLDWINAPAKAVH